MSPLLEKNVQLVVNTPYYHFCLTNSAYDTDDAVVELRYLRKKLVLERTNGSHYYEKKCEDCGKIFRLVSF